MKLVLLSLAVAPVLLCLAANAPANAQEPPEIVYTQPATAVDGFEVSKHVSRAADIDSEIAPATRVAAAHKCRAGAPCERHRRIH
jgi:hypothetical protein